MIILNRIRIALSAIGLMESEFKRDIRVSIVQYESIANLLESVIMTGEYRGVFMCNVLKRISAKDPSQTHLVELAISEIMERIQPEQTLMNYLHNRLSSQDIATVEQIYSPSFIHSGVRREPLTHEQELQFLEARLCMTKFYWDLIRKLRRTASVWRADLPLMG